jgi:collagenase-like PrtC family protease
MLPLNVPFLPEASYVQFLKDLGPRLHSVYFSLYGPALCDARVRLRDLDIQTLVAHLEPLRGLQKYVLANGRFQPSDAYQSGESLRRLIESLDHLLSANVLDGLIFADSYLLTALADAAPALASRLEAVPSINFGLDRIDQLAMLLELTSSNGFRSPGKIPLDRSLNHRPEALAALSREIRRQWPTMKIELLANEGCLPHCPFRSTHEALIAAANVGMRIDTHRLNNDLACIRILNRTPHLIFTSPFIRPEDTDRYAESADLIKISGRTLGAGFLKRAAGAYAEGRYRGNLLDLLDTAHWMANRWDIPNNDLPENLIDIHRSAGQSLFERHARPKPLRIPTFAETSP